MELSRDEFEDLVAEALDTIPPELTAHMRNVVIVVEDDAPERGCSACTKGYP